MTNSIKKKQTEKPIWLTEELSEEWISYSSKDQNKIKLNSTSTSASSSTSQIKSNSNSISKSKIPIKSNKLLSVNSISNSNLNSNSNSNSSIILNNNENNNNESSNHLTPPWLKVAIDGMVNQVLGKKPNQLEKLFNQNSPQQNQKQNLILPSIKLQSSDSNNYIHRIPSISTSDPSNTSFIPNVQFQFSVPRSNAPLISFEDSQLISMQPDSNHQATQESHKQDQGENHLDEYLSIPTSFNHHDMERFRFNRDNRLDEIIEVTEPSSSTCDSRKFNQSRTNSSNFASLPSSFIPPSLPFAHRTPVIDPNGRIHRIKSDTQLSNRANSHHPYSSHDSSKIPSCDKSELSTSPTHFRFTYDTFTRRHLNRLTEEIHGLSIHDQIAPPNTAPLKIKSILGSPGEEVTDSSTSIGLAHSTPPSIFHPSSKTQQRIFQAGRTPFRPITSLSQRLREEKQWNDSFVQPSSYAIDNLSTLVERKCYQDLKKPHDENFLASSSNLNQPDIQTAHHSCRSSKRIRLESSQPTSEVRHRQLRDSISLTNHRNPARRTPAFTRVHPMVVFKASTGTITTNSTPHEKPPGSQTVVRDRLAEAKALMDRIRAKTTPNQTDTLNQTSPQKQTLQPSNPPTQIDYSLISEQEYSIPDDEEFNPKGDQVASCSNQVDEHVRKQSEPALKWDISIYEGSQDDRDKEENDEEQCQNATLLDNEKAAHDLNELGASDSVHQRLASSAAAFLRQTLGDQNGHEKLNQQQQYGSSSTSTSTNLASTTNARRQFATQPIFREPIGRVTNDPRNHLTRSNSNSACNTASITTPALTIATTTRQSSNSSHSQRLVSEDYVKQLHTQKHGLMTIAPCDVEELLQNRRIGNMVFDSTIGKWVKIRSQSDIGGMVIKTDEDGDINMEATGKAGSQQEESTDEEDIFKDIESLNSKRESDSSGSGLLAQLNSKPQMDFVQNSQNLENISQNQRNQTDEVSNTTSHFLPIQVKKIENDLDQSSKTSKKISIVKGEKFKPKSVLKAANESPNEKSDAIMIPGSIDKSKLEIGVLKSGRSVSFQDGRKNGKIIGLVDTNEAEEENELETREEFIKEQHKTLKENNMNRSVFNRKHKQSTPTVELKGDKQDGCRGISHRDQNSAIDLEHSFDSNENNQSLLNQTSIILINSAKRKVRRKSSSSNSIGATNSHNSSLINTPTLNRSHSANVHDNFSIANSNSNDLIYDSNSNNNMISEYSFELNYSKLIKIITDFEPFEPFWNSIKVIDLSNKSIDSVIRLNEILPLLDQIDLSSNQLNYLTGLPSTLRVLIIAKNQINELCSFNHLQNLVRLDLSQNSLTTLQQLSCLKHLRELKADENLITDFSGIDQLDGLVKLSLKGNRIKKVNFETCNWCQLEVLNLDRNQIWELTGLHFLKSVYLLNLDRNQICSLAMDNLLPNLRVLRINENRLESLDVSKLINLRTLYIDNNDLMEISGASQVRKLENLSVRDQRGGELSLPLQQVRDVKRIYLGGNPLPAAFPTSQFYNLTYLELAMCQCQNLPSDLAYLIPNVRTLNLNYNFLKDISALKNLKRIERLTIVGSRIKTLDTNLLNVLGSLPELELLDLRQNPLCASFYPPLLLNSTPSSSIIESETGRKSGRAPHLNQYQIVVKEQEDDWQSIDDRFRKSLPNEFYLKRMTYRSIIVKTCGHKSLKKLKCLDGIKINEVERKKMEKFLRGLSRKLDQKSHSSSLNVQREDVEEEDKTQKADHHIRSNQKLPNSHSSNLDQIQKPVKTNQSGSSKSRDRKQSSTNLLDQSNNITIIDRSRY